MIFGIVFWLTSLLFLSIPFLIKWRLMKRLIYALIFLIILNALFLLSNYLINISEPNIKFAHLSKVFLMNCISFFYFSLVLLLTYIVFIVTIYWKRSQKWINILGSVFAPSCRENMRSFSWSWVTFHSTSVGFDLYEKPLLQ